MLARCFGFGHQGLADTGLPGASAAVDNCGDVAVGGAPQPFFFSFFPRVQVGAGRCYRE